MITEAYRYRFGENVDLAEAENTLLLSVLAAEGLHGEARVRMDAGYAIDPSIRVIVVDASTEVGQVVNSIFTAFLLREFGRLSFHVRRVEGVGSECGCAAPTGTRS